ncbi:hypothetical protein C0Q70_17055 [Pomacea canaliculata]|uniref:CARD domain-containing protein n=1 Tax=Pomacea canaliculata TaxID=400727 RepID=A0A2T7NRH8_POMCA|nr:hypothetical protein C0Q70_17055 [Pomacea canaliculata]
MEALKVKYEQNKAEVLSHLDVNSDLLDVMTRHGLIDISDWVKFKNVAEARERNATLMKTLVERRTDHAYPLFIQSLRDVGQHTVADLLTDIGERLASSHNPTNESGGQRDVTTQTCAQLKYT